MRAMPNSMTTSSFLINTLFASLVGLSQSLLTLLVQLFGSSVSVLQECVPKMEGIRVLMGHLEWRCGESLWCGKVSLLEVGRG